MDRKISVIIPTFNEEDNISRLISLIKTCAIGVDFEIVVADGGSTDNTIQQAYLSKAIVLKCPVKGRAAQLNYGAAHASGDVFFFLHADSYPPQNLLHHIKEALSHGYTAGCFRLKFDSDNRFLRANAWLTRFDVDAFRFGDQGLFVTRELFERSGGYRNDLIVMEDQEIVKRLRSKGARFRIIPDYMVTSARKYLDNGPVRLQYTFFLIWFYYQRGRTQQELVQLYKTRIKDKRVNEKQTRRIRPAVDDLYKESGTGEG